MNARRLLALALVAPALSACHPGDATEPGRQDARTYAMGWAPTAPRADVSLVLAVMDSMSRVSDIAILQQPVPWPELLAGAPMDSLVEDRASVATYLRNLGMDIIFLVDPLDGLDRRKEDPGLVDTGHSILEPSIRALHDQWVLRIAQRVKPAYFGLASEINTLAARGDPTLYAAVRAMINDLAPQVRQRSPGTRVFVSFQADEANGRLGPEPVDDFALIGDFDIDALGLSSYPVFAFDSPADIPADYFQKFADATDLPLLLVEGGWSSADVPWAHGTPEQQVELIDRFEELLDGVKAEAWVMLTFTDLDVNALGLDPERAAGLSNFAHMGILDTQLHRKPAYAAWERIYQRPLAR
jgi:hypothetical protein